MDSKKKEYDSNPKFCANKDCGRKIEYGKRRNKYCDHSCAAKVVNVGVRRHGKPPNLCLQCGEKTYGYKHKYCSRSCYSDHVHILYIEKWLKGLDKGYSCGVNTEEKINPHIKKWLIETRGEKCEKCGWNETHPDTGKVPIQINHKDGNCRNNRPENLEIICPNCHSLTSTFGALNKGNGRNNRRKKQ